LIEKLRGSHTRRIVSAEGETYVAGIDIAGQVSDAGLGLAARMLNRQDETVITIATVHFESQPEQSRLPSIKIVEHYRWRGLSHAEQYDRIEKLLTEIWNVARVSVDATGVGAGVTSFLLRAMPSRLDPVVFTVKSKSDLGFALLAAAETGRLSMYQTDGGENSTEFWKQLRLTQYRLRGSEEMDFSVPASDGHDDFVMSLALAVRAAEALSSPAVGGLVRARPEPDDMAEW
ncbi:MAG TPA: hypothetical protein VG815_14315, partial [Chloroflexota bacterium]|nr:hypothetical protein [Chloroflexota bacterium]